MLTRYITLMAGRTPYNTMWESLSMTCDRSVVFSWYSVFSTNKINAKIYSWNIVESGVKYHKFPLKLLHCYLLGCFIPHILRSVCMNINIYSFLETVLRCNLCVKIWRWNINWKAFIWHYLLIAHHLSKIKLFMAVLCPLSAFHLLRTSLETIKLRKMWAY